MADFRKLFLALIAGALLFGTVASAADYNCTATAVPTIVRSEAVADFVGDVLLNCGGTLPIGTTNITANIRMTLSATVTSQLLTGSSQPTVSEGTLVLDGTREWACPVALSGSWPNYWCSQPMYLTSTLAPKGYQSISSSALTPYMDGSQNVFQAVQLGPNQLEWQGVVLVGAGSNPGTQTIRLTNVRASAAGLTAGSGITATINITSPTSVPLTNNVLTVANVTPGMTTVITPASSAIKVCGSSSGTFTVSFAEGFGTSFKPKWNNFAGAVPHNIPGGGYFDESGFNPVWDSGDGSTPAGSLPANRGVLASILNIGVASAGTKLAVDITNVPAGTTMSAAVTSPTSNGLQIAVDSVGPISSGSTTYRVILSVTGYTGSGLAQYYPDVVAPSITVTVGTANLTDPSNPPKAHARFDPLSTQPNAAAVGSSAPVPRFLDSSSAGDLGVFSSVQNCNSVLLFPYLTSSAGYESGIAISNTAQDPFSTVGQSGGCTLNFYGRSGSAALTAGQKTQTSTVIPQGAQLISLVSAGLTGGWVSKTDGTQAAACPTGSTNCAAIPAFAGYMIAQCNFQWAHGYAFITDTNSARTQGYLALIIPDPGSSSRTLQTGGEQLNN